MSTNTPSQSRGTRTVTTAARNRKIERRAKWLSCVWLPFAIAAMFFVGVAGPILLQRWELFKQRVDEEPVSDIDRLGQAFVSEIENYKASRDKRLPQEDHSRIAESLANIDLQIEFARSQQTIEQCKASGDAWLQLYESTRTDKVGKRIGSSDDLIADFKALDLPKEQGSVIADFKSRLDAVQNAGSETGTILKQIQRDAYDTYSTYERQLRLLAEIRAEAEHIPPGPKTLNEAIKSYDQRILDNRTLAIQTAENETEHRLQAELADLKSATDSLSTPIDELRGDLTQLKQGSTPASGTLPLSVAGNASRSDYERELPQLKSLLKPFITGGYAQPKSTNEMTFVSDKKPISYSGLRRVGALDEGEDGLEILARIGGSKSDRPCNDRPLGTFPPYDLNSSSKAAQIKEAQRLLRGYGLLMVEDRLLSP